jgi:hypothetical protein
MKALALIGGLALAACDDPQVAGAAADLLQFGAVQAKVTCAGVQTHLSDDCPTTGGDTYIGHRLADGSAFVSVSYLTFWLGRSEPEAETMAVKLPAYPLDTWSVADGELRVHKDGCTDVVVDIETECTGFNLEAFGVE